MSSTRRAEARRADERAVAAGQAALGDVVPALVLEVARRAGRGGRSASSVAAHPLGGAGDGRGPRRRGRRGGRVAPGARRASRAPRSVPTSTRKRCSPSRISVSARSYPPSAFGPGAHRRAEARAARLEAVDGDDEGVLAPRRVVAVGVATAEEDPILDRDRVQLAGAHADEGERRIVERLLLDLEAAVSAAGLPEPDARRAEELLPGMRADREAEARLVVAPLEPVAPASCVVCPPDRQRRRPTRAPRRRSRRRARSGRGRGSRASAARRRALRARSDRRSRVSQALSQRLEHGRRRVSDIGAGAAPVCGFAAGPRCGSPVASELGCWRPGSACRPPSVAGFASAASSRAWASGRSCTAWPGATGSAGFVLNDGEGVADRGRGRRTSTVRRRARERGAAARADHLGRHAAARADSARPTSRSSRAAPAAAAAP